MAGGENLDGAVSQLISKLKPMEEKFTCSFCKRFFREPTMMVCNHIFCKICIPKNYRVSMCLMCKATCETKELRPAEFIVGMLHAYQQIDASMAAVKNKLCPIEAPTRECPFREIPPSMERGGGSGINDIHDLTTDEVVKPTRERELIPVPPGSKKKTRASGMMDSCPVALTSRNISWREKLAQVKVKFPNVPRYEDECVFCHSIRRKMEGMGELLCVQKGKVVTGPDESSGDAVHYAHQNCLDWASGVCFEGSQVLNLKQEIDRTARQICGKCGRNGAAISCFYCPMTYHSPCAYYIDECRWDTDNRRMLCPAHNSKKLP